MMIDPETFAEQHKEKSYRELLELRDEMLGYIKEFEEADAEVEVKMYPTPETVYQVNLQYLGKLCELIAEKYNQEFVF